MKTNILITEVLAMIEPNAAANTEQLDAVSAMIARELFEYQSSIQFDLAFNITYLIIGFNLEQTLISKLLDDTTAFYANHYLLNFVKELGSYELEKYNYYKDLAKIDENLAHREKYTFNLERDKEEFDKLFEDGELFKEMTAQLLDDLEDDIATK